MSKLLFTLSIVMAFSFGNATEMENGLTTPEEALELLLNNANTMTAINPDHKEHLGYPVVKILSESLLKTNGMSASCEWRGKSLLQDCRIVISEGKGLVSQSQVSITMVVLNGALFSEEVLVEILK